MSLKNYKVLFKVEKTYEVDLATAEDPNTDEGEDNIMERITEDYLTGNIKDEEQDCQFKLGEIEEV